MNKADNAYGNQNYPANNNYGFNNDYLSGKKRISYLLLSYLTIVLETCFSKFYSC